MRIVLLTETFSKKMGYLDQTLPKYLARCGAEVHVITNDLQPYYQLKDFNQTYGSFAAQNELHPGSVEAHEGYTLHVLPHQRALGYMRTKGLCRKLSAIRPEIVQTFAAIGWQPLEAGLMQPFLGFRLFTGNHTSPTTFPLARKEEHKPLIKILKNFVTRKAPGRATSWRTEKCYVVSQDSGEIARRFFGVQERKIEVQRLGVDCDFFSPVRTPAEMEQRLQLRNQLGFGADDIVCVYSGKLTEVKNAYIVVQAIERLCEAGLPFRGLFIGEGPQQELIRAHGSCVTLGFMDFRKLGSYYRAADIGVWPTDESTSTLDLAACGIPIVVSDFVNYRGETARKSLVFKLNDLKSLTEILTRLSGRDDRIRLGTQAAEEMAREFSMESVARRRLRDYEAALKSDGGR